MTAMTAGLPPFAGSPPVCAELPEPQREECHSSQSDRHHRIGQERGKVFHEAPRGHNGTVCRRVREHAKTPRHRGCVWDACGNHPRARHAVSWRQHAASGRQVIARSLLFSWDGRGTLRGRMTRANFIFLGGRDSRVLEMSHSG